jgi:hypothetical protein
MRGRAILVKTGTKDHANSSVNSFVILIAYGGQRGASARSGATSLRGAAEPWYG